MFDYLKKIKLLLKKHIDKIAHFGVFFISMLYFSMFINYFINNKIITIIISSILFNIFSFLLEKLDDRKDIYDIITNTLAIIFCIIHLYYFL